MTPDIVFIAGCPGSGGHYLARILQTLSRGWEPNLEENYFHLHNVTSNLNVINTIPSIPYDKYKTEIHNYCGLGEFVGNLQNLYEGQDFFKDNLTYDNLGFAFHIILAHVINPLPFLGVKYSKVIRIDITEEDSQQLAYNFVKKMVQTDIDELKPLALDTVIKELKKVQNTYRKLRKLDPNSIDLNDDKLITYLYWLCNKNSYTATANFTIPADENILHVKFADLMDGKIKDQIPDIARFIGAPLTSKISESCSILVDMYTKEQKKIPWNLSINDY